MLWLGAIVHLATTSWQQLKYVTELVRGGSLQGRAGHAQCWTFFSFFFFVSQLKGLSFSAKVPLISSERNRPYV